MEQIDVPSPSEWFLDNQTAVQILNNKCSKSAEVNSILGYFIKCAENKDIVFSFIRGAENPADHGSCQDLTVAQAQRKATYAEVARRARQNTIKQVVNNLASKLSS